MYQIRNWINSKGRNLLIYETEREYILYKYRNFKLNNAKSYFFLKIEHTNLKNIFISDTLTDASF
jgi:hypothetical protein